MGKGLDLVKAHIASFYAGRTEDFAHQLTPNFRQRHMPAAIGVGPKQVQRFDNVIFANYQEWNYVTEDEHENGKDVIVRIKSIGTKPVDPNMPPVSEYSVLVHYELEGDRIASCDLLHMDLDDFEETALKQAPASLS